MFAFAIGLLLPATDEGDALSTRLEALRDLEFELRQRLSLPRTDLALLIWWHSASGGALPTALELRLEALAAAHPGLKNAAVDDLPGGLERWLMNSQVVVQITLAAAAPSARQRCEALLLERRLAHSLEGWSTLVQRLYPNTDGGLPWQRFRGSQELDQERAGEHQPLRELQDSLASFHGARATHLLSTSSAGTLPAAESLESHRAADGARATAERLARRSDRRLGLQAAALVLLVTVARLGMKTVVPDLLLLLIGVWLLSRQPLRQRGQQWWCVADGLWIQDLWHRFGLEDAPADWLPRRQPLASGNDRGALVGLLKAHQLALWLEPAAGTWGRVQLADAIEALRGREALIEQALLRHRAIQLGMGVLLGFLAVLMVASQVQQTIWLDQLLLGLAVAVAALWLAKPLPLVHGERLSQHLSRLESALAILIRLQAMEDLEDPALRQTVIVTIRRIGAEVLDLCCDGLQAARAKRRWLP